MAQIHALLMVAAEPMNTDEIMEALATSRGSTNMNLHELINWGLVRTVVQKGDRKDYFVSEKDVWKMFRCIARERKRREVEPVLHALEDCRNQTAGITGNEAKAFNKTVCDLLDFVELMSGALDKIGRSERSLVLPLLLKLLK
jgi:DNA-binding transcriptional regulator GbsR (MarR family)